jgi:hypothetical protein
MSQTISSSNGLWNRVSSFFSFLLHFDLFLLFQIHNVLSRKLFVIITVLTIRSIWIFCGRRSLWSFSKWFLVNNIKKIDENLLLITRQLFCFQRLPFYSCYLARWHEVFHNAVNYWLLKVYLLTGDGKLSNCSCIEITLFSWSTGDDARYSKKVDCFLINLI